MESSSSYFSFSFLIVILIFLTTFLVQQGRCASIQSSICGCMEKDVLLETESLASMVLGPSESSDVQTSKCDLFCSTKSGSHFAKLDNGICSCYKSEDLSTFDCDEVIRIGPPQRRSPAFPVYCVSSSSISFYFNFSSPSSESLALEEDTWRSSTLLSSQNSSLGKEEESAHKAETEDFHVGKGIAPAAIVLGVLSVVVLILLGFKTWYDNQRSKMKRKESELSPAKIKSPSTWNFNEYKLKETRFEDNV